jgi:ribonuclease BN (tRNA processing enzyme)
MKIVFFGSSHGYPEPHRKCSSTLIEVGNKKYFIDMGCNCAEGLANRRIPIEKIDGIFITHMHGDHTNGLIPFLDICSWKFKDANPKIYAPCVPEQLASTIAGWLRLTGTTMREFEFNEVTDGFVYDDGNLKVTAFKTLHTKNSYSYLLEAEGKRVLFSGDLSVHGPQEDFPVSVLNKPLDLAICEAAHFKATDYLPFFENNNNLKQLCFNHYSDRFLESVIEMTRLLPDIPVYRATDDMEITL